MIQPNTYTGKTAYQGPIAANYDRDRVGEPVWQSEQAWFAGWAARVPAGARVLDVPIAPCVVGLILGPLAEQQFRRALAISEGDPTVFFTHPIALALLIVAALLVAGPMMLRRPREPGRA